MSDNNRELVLGNTAEELVSSVSEKMTNWFRSLNNIVGVLSFSLAIGCLGTNHPKVYALVSIMFVCAIMYMLRNFFPNEIKELRKKDSLTELESVLLKGMEAHFLSVRKTFLEAPVYWLGLVSLILVFSGVDEFILKIIEMLK